MDSCQAAQRLGLQSSKIPGFQVTAGPESHFYVLFFHVLAHPVVFPGEHYIDSQPSMFSRQGPHTVNSGTLKT